MIWIPGEDGVVALRTSSLGKLDSPLPEMNESVFLLWFDGRESSGFRANGFEKDCGWMWYTQSGTYVAGHPLIVAWRPIPTP